MYLGYLVVLDVMVFGVLNFVTLTKGWTKHLQLSCTVCLYSYAFSISKQIDLQCSLNYKGSSPAMKNVGAEKIFKQSVTNHNLYYTSFYGDGDLRAFPAAENNYGLEKPVT